MSPVLRRLSVALVGAVTALAVPATSSAHDPTTSTSSTNVPATLDDVVEETVPPVGSEGSPTTAVVLGAAAIVVVGLGVGVSRRRRR
jgi:hypothetical protein